MRAFPVLQEHARRFRRWRDGLATFCVIWLLLTALAYWDAGLGRVALERLDQNWKVFIDELRDDPTLLACDEQPPAVLKAAVDAKVNLDAARAELACRRHAYQLWKGTRLVKRSKACSAANR